MVFYSIEPKLFASITVAVNDDFIAWAHAVMCGSIWDNRYLLISDDSKRQRKPGDSLGKRNVIRCGQNPCKTVGYIKKHCSALLGTGV